MKKFVLCLLLLALAGAAYVVVNWSSAPQFTLEEGYHYLYDGKSLAGWRTIGGEATFAAEGEDIVGRRGPGENTFLRTDKTYGDFSLKMQMRWDEPGNSGVLFRAQQRTVAGDPDGDGDAGGSEQRTGRAYGYQFELDDSERAWSGGIYDEARRGWLASLADKPEVRAAIRPDDWNDIEIEARGARIRTWINGVLAADIIDGLDAQGFIALQVHQGDTGVMRWRRIRLKELPAMAKAGDSLLAAAEWRLENIDDLEITQAGMAGALPDGEFWLTARRQFSDAMVRMTVPACDAPTTIQLRYLADDSGNGSNKNSGASFAEVKIYADRAEGRLVTAAGEQVSEPVSLENAAQHRVVAVMMGGSITLTVDEVDALRVSGTGLPERGQLRIQPARCGDDFHITDLDWFSLSDSSGEPVFYQTLDNKPAPVLSPEEAQAAFSIAPGFEIELVAAEPLVGEPVAMAWDEYGRIYVVEMRGYMPDAYGTGSEEPVGQIVRLEDIDGDGRMDTSEVFLGGLVNPRAVAVVNEGVLVGEPPNLWLCELPARDALCENKRRIGSYGTNLADTNVEHMENGLRQGLDNWLYNSKSARSLRIENGELVEREGVDRGQWGITQDNVGRLLYNHNATWIQADFFAAEDLVQPGSQLYPEGLGVNLTDPAEVFSVRVNPGVNRAYLEGTLRKDGRLLYATGVSGLVSYRGDQFPDAYHSDVFVPEVAGNVVAQFDINEQGMALTAAQRLYDDEKWGTRDFLASTDERFRPVDAMNGPDGALYVIDMYRGIVQDVEFMTDELREQVFQRGLETPIGMGRIWRVRHTEGKAGRGFPELASASNEELVAALASPNGWVRDTAQRLLLAREGDLTTPLGNLAMTAMASDDYTVAALHAVWTLQGRGELQREQVMALANSGRLPLQLQVLRAGHSLLQVADLLQLHRALQDAAGASLPEEGLTQTIDAAHAEALSMQLAFALGDHAIDASVREALAQLLIAELASPYVRQAVVRAASGQELAFLQELLASGQLAQSSEGAQQALAALASGAYRSLRGDLTSGETANPQLLELLALAASRSGEFAWQQLAMLRGMEDIAISMDFVPAKLAAAPPIFADGSVGEDDPLWAGRMAARVSFTWPGDELAAGIKPLSPAQLEALALGEKFYPQCAACHGSNGAGVAGLAPPLAGASWVTGPPEWLARIILQGLTGPVNVKGETYNGMMPPHGHLKELDDITLAGLMTYMRRNWGNKADPVSVETVAAIRAASADRSQPWTVAELEAVAVDRGFKRFEGEFVLSFITLTFEEKPDGLYISVPMYGGGKMEQVNATTFTAQGGGESGKIEFVVEPNGVVNSLILHRKGEKIRAQRKP
jgi:mono/diheme cytochrome c family protein/glucose/arabinose dehydrogenase